MAQPAVSRFLASSLLILAVAQAAAGEGLSNLYRITNGISDTHLQYENIAIAPGGEVVLADIEGPGKITYFYITDSGHGHFYAGLVLKVFWDDHEEPSINVPLSDFFGAITFGSMTGTTIDYESVPMQINHYCYMCYLPMPFSKRARFVLANDGHEDYSKSVAYGIDYVKDKSFASEKSRLHCQWRRSNPTQDGMHTMLDTKGRGQYVGNFLQTFSRHKGWWGEGDTTFHIDGKTVTHTPGTEDEYGACWEFEHTYSYMYSGYIQKDKGKNRMYRWYIANPVRFQDSLKVEIQNQRWAGAQVSSKDDYISIAFWYQQGAQPITLQPYKERLATTKAARYKD